MMILYQVVDSKSRLNAREGSHCVTAIQGFSSVFAGFGKQISLGVFGTDFDSDVMTTSLQLSKSERKVSCFWQSKTT
jgi:hypothetical protein